MVATVSTLAQANLIRNESDQLQSKINALQQQTTTGLKASVYSDLGSQASLDIDLRNQLDRISAFQTNISTLQTSLSVVDQNLTSINNTAQSLYDLTVQSGNTDQGRQSIIAQANTAITQITQQLQTSVDGKFLFGGVATSAQPMVSDQTVLASVKAAINTALTAVPAPTNIPAAIQSAVASVFATQSNFYVGGTSTAPTEVDQGLTMNLGITGNNQAFIDTLEGAYTMAALSQPVAAPATLPALDQPTFDQVVQNAASQLFTGASEVQNLITQNGANQAQLTSINSQDNQTLTLLQGQVDNIEQVNLADVSTRLSQLQTQLQASYSLTAQLKSLSLVNFLAVPTG
jgi:flagellar hook-associated protein 3 FlgL